MCTLADGKQASRRNTLNTGVNATSKPSCRQHGAFRRNSAQDQSWINFHRAECTTGLTAHGTVGELSTLTSAFGISILTNVVVDLTADFLFGSNTPKFICSLQCSRAAGRQKGKS